MLIDDGTHDISVPFLLSVILFGGLFLFKSKKTRRFFDIKAGATLLVLGEEGKGVATVKVTVKKKEESKMQGMI